MPFPPWEIQLKEFSFSYPPVILLVGFASHHYLVFPNSFSKTLCLTVMSCLCQYLIQLYPRGSLPMQYLNCPLSTWPVFSCICDDNRSCFCKELPGQETLLQLLLQIWYFSSFFQPVKLFWTQVCHSGYFHIFHPSYCHFRSLDTRVVPEVTKSGCLKCAWFRDTIPSAKFLQCLF